MRRTIYFLGICMAYACNMVQSDEEPHIADSVQAFRYPDTVYVVRNTLITPANSYNDLFLDSGTVEQFIQQKNLSAEDSQGVKSFYNYRNGQFAWFSSNGFSEQAKGFWNLKDEFKTTVDDTVLQKRMDTLLNTDTLLVSRFDTSIANTELGLTLAYLKFYHANRSKLQFTNVSPERFIPVKRENTSDLADSLMKRGPDSLKRGSASSQYFLLKEKLTVYDSIADRGGWQPLRLQSKKFKKNSSSADVLLLKKRLQMTGDYPGTDTSKVYNDSLEIAIKRYKQRNGLDSTAAINDTLIQSLNIPVEHRIRQLIINMQRSQWMTGAKDSNFIYVNIPDQILTVFENGSMIFDMPVVVGKEGTNTMIFSGDLNQVVFSPYWNIPASIVRKEILPAVKADPDYLRKNRMEITGRNDSLPVIRQLPGENNSLGDVKFLFPNRYDIYFHDTKAKDIFKTKKRALSHGCIRLADAEKMANYLLRGDAGWTPEKVSAAMRSGKEQYVRLSKPVPVSIAYLTAWVDNSGELQFRDDIYGHDKQIIPMMFTNNSQPAINSGDSVSRKK